MKKIKFEEIGTIQYTIAIFVFMLSILIGAILYRIGFVSLAIIFGYIAAGAFIYLLTVGLLITFISWELDYYMEKKETKKHGA